MSQTDSIRFNVSDKLRFMLEEANQACAEFEKADKETKKNKGYAKETVHKAYYAAINEGFTPETAKELLFTSITKISKRSLYLYLPDEAKDKEMQALARKRNKKAAPLQVAATRLEAMRQRGKRFQASANVFPGMLSLKNELAMKVYDALKKDRTAQFLLTHDGKVVLSVEIESILQDPSHVMQESATVISSG